MTEKKNKLFLSNNNITWSKNLILIEINAIQTKLLIKNNYKKYDIISINFYI